MGFILPEAVKLTSEYNADTDASFVSSSESVAYHATENTFAVIFPGEPHAANLKDGSSSEVIRVAFKILV
jgi:beta-galactosidase beta subunit